MIYNRLMKKKCQTHLFCVVKRNIPNTILLPIKAVYICTKPIDVRNMFGKPMVCTSIYVAV